MEAATSDSDWMFMEPWFQTLEEAGVEDDPNQSSDCDDVRVGRDPGDETWIGVGLSRETLNVDREQDENEDDEAVTGWAVGPGVAVRLRMLREAIILMSLLGRTDYERWRTMMQDHAGFDGAHHYKVPVNGALLPMPIQFYFELRTEHPIELFDWSTCMRHLLGNQLYSEDFEADQGELTRLLTQRGIKWEQLEPTPIKISLVLEAEPQGDEMVARRIMRLIDSIQRTQKIERAERSAGRSCCSLFKIVSIDVDLTEVYLHDSIVDALTSLFEVGVPVAMLCLPKLGHRRPAMTSWGRCVRLITGVDRDDEGRLASATRIEMPIEYAGTAYFAAVCSALACAQGVQEFVLTGAQDRADISDESDDRNHMWRWLAFVFHNEVATTSVRTLIIDGERPLAHEVMSFKETIESSDPFALLGHIAFEGLNADFSAEEGAYAFLHTWIPRKTVLCVRDDTWSADCQLRDDVKAEMFLCPSASGDARLFIPGYGFCVAQLPEPSTKRPKLEPVFHPLQRTLPLTSLVLRPIDELSTSEIKNLLSVIEILGPPLHSLRVETNFDENALKKILAACPKLASLAVANLSLTSFAVFEEAYASGARISSLRLESMIVPTEAIDTFVRSLAHTNPPKHSVAGTLERLYWGSCWPGYCVDSTFAMFTEVLQKNPVLTHLHGMHSASARVPEELIKYHGQRLPGLNRSQRAQLMTFLGGLRAIETRSPVVRLDAFLKTRVWEFAISPAYRNVLWTLDQESRLDEM